MNLLFLLIFMILTKELMRQRKAPLTIFIAIYRFLQAGLNIGPAPAIELQQGWESPHITQEILVVRQLFLGAENILARPHGHNLENVMSPGYPKVHKEKDEQVLRVFGQFRIITQKRLLNCYQFYFLWRLPVFRAPHHDFDQSGVIHIGIKSPHFVSVALKQRVIHKLFNLLIDR